MEYKKGDEVIVAIIKGSNASRYKNMSIENIKEWTYNGEVVSSGRKYVTVKFGYHVEKFEVENNYLQKYTCGGADYKLYKSIEDILCEREQEELYDYLRSKFSMWSNPNISLDALRQIRNLIEGNEI